ncbi:MAG TPA: DUF1801 domain-containing protein [Candidatus Thermoplasmatota archaeon]|nr:DUF1801 domain-containing protein [Candidatus Thermoplasmatota archaeon]
MTQAKPATVADYLASTPQPHRRTLQAMRRAILAALPGAEERISYGIPGFREPGGNFVVWIAAFPKHCSLFPANADLVAAVPEAKRYLAGRATLHCPPDKPFPASLVRKVVKARVAQNKAWRASRAARRAGAAKHKPERKARRQVAKR